LLDDRRSGGEEADPVRALALAELRSELAGELAAISADQARVVVLKDALDWSYEEISTRSGMPVGTAKCYAHRGRSSLRMRLEGA
jgi:RNA polymerase sigma-70 factor, ECF subfamily